MKVDTDKNRIQQSNLPLSIGRPGANSDSVRQKYLARYEQLKKLGEPFFPDTVLKDIIASFVLFLILVGLAIFLGAPLEERADPTNTAYVPRPEWYFMFMFELLKYFPGELEWVGVAVVPGIAILFLIALPFIDRSVVRHPRQRRLAMNLATVCVAGIALLTLRAYQFTPNAVASLITSPPAFAASASRVPEVKLTAGQEAGKRLFQAQNCSSCHSIGGVGGSVGPDLSQVGSRRDLAWLHEYIENPKGKNPAARMPSFLPPLSHQEVEWLAQYLATLR